MFTINDETWDVKFVDADDPILFRIDGSQSVAVTIDETKTIYLSEGLYGNFLKKVLSHEITHTFIFSLDIYLTIEQEEWLADFISNYARDIIHITDEVYKRINGEG